MFPFLALLLACSGDEGVPDPVGMAHPAAPAPSAPGADPAAAHPPATTPPPTTTDVPAGVISGEPILPEPVVVGAISTADVEAGLAPQLAAIHGCHATGAAAARSGKILVKFRVTHEGRVAEPTTASTTFRDPTLEACVNAQVFLARFPALTEGDVAIVQYPFVFPAVGR
jgi:hypothetical protein